MFEFLPLKKKNLNVNIKIEKLYFGAKRVDKLGGKGCQTQFFCSSFHQIQYKFRKMDGTSADKLPPVTCTSVKAVSPSSL